MPMCSDQQLTTDDVDGQEDSDGAPAWKDNTACIHGRQHPYCERRRGPSKLLSGTSMVKLNYSNCLLLPWQLAGILCCPEWFESFGPR